MSVQKIAFWIASFMSEERDGVCLDGSGFQVLFERHPCSAFVFRWYPYTLLSLSVRTAMAGFERDPFQFSVWLDGAERFGLSFCPRRTNYGWHRLLDLCQPNLFGNSVYFCFQKAFSCDS